MTISKRPAHKPLSPAPPTDLPDPEDTVSDGTRSFTPKALRLLLACSRQITMGLAHALSKLWRRGDPVQAGFAERMLVQVELEKVRAVSEIQRARLGRFPTRQRKHYTTEERFRIVVSNAELRPQ